MTTNPSSPTLTPYDAVLLLSFGGPESQDEVLPFLRRVTAGRGIPDERLAIVGEHYTARGGVSPINGENRDLLAALRRELGTRGLDVPVLWGNRNAAPFLIDALRAAHDAGLRRVVVVVTSAYAGYSSCRQYREDLAAAAEALAGEGRHLVIDKVRPYALTEAFLAANAQLLAQSWPVEAGTDTRLLFVTHSVPEAAAATSGPPDARGAYVSQHETVARRILDRLPELRSLPWELVYCSRSGAPGQPWLEPDVGDRIEELAKQGVRRVVLAPIGFVSDHMEVVHDLDTEAVGVGRSCGVEVVRVPTVRCHPVHVAGLVDLLLERAAEARGEDVEPWRAVLGGDLPSTCAAGCCPGRAPKPAAAGAEPCGEEQQA